MTTDGLPELVELALLVDVAETGSLGQAAVRHGLSQPAVSMRMTALERRLGLRLLRRDPSGTRLTPVGNEIVGAARRVLGSARELATLADRHRADDRNLLRLAASFTVAEQLLPSWIPALQARSPGVALSLEVVNSARVLTAVTEHRVDIGFAEGVAREVPGVVSADVRGDELVVLVVPGHPWARRPRPVTATTLAGTELIVREHGSGTREVLDAALTEFGGTRTRLALGSTAAVLAAAMSGEAPAVVSRLAAAGDIAAGLLVPVPTAGVDLVRTLRALWPSDAPPGPAARHLLDAAREPGPEANG